MEGIRRGTDPDCNPAPGDLPDRWPFPSIGAVIRALFLDAAGTVIEPAESVAEVYARHAAAFGHPVEPAAVKQWFGAAFSGVGDPYYREYADGDAAERQWWMRVVDLVFNKTLGAPLPEGSFRPCFEALFAHYADPSAWRVFPEVPQVLEEARAAGLQLAVVSNFDRRLHGILAGHGLRFDAVITSAEACARKPEPAIFQAALAVLGRHPKEVLHAGDSPSADIEGAARAGIGACLVKRPDHDLRAFLARALALRVK
jgi:putative hydrolase of the HAD superfamily